MTKTTSVKTCRPPLLLKTVTTDHYEVVDRPKEAVSREQTPTDNLWCPLRVFAPEVVKDVVPGSTTRTDRCRPTVVATCPSDHPSFPTTQARRWSWSDRSIYTC